MQSFKCPKCNTEITLEKRAHICPATRSLHGEMVGTLTIYNPSISQPTKQMTQEGYVKRWGSRANRVRRSGKVAIFMLENQAVKS